MTAALPPGRGAAWVWAQSVLMAAQLAAGPLLPATWHSPGSLVAGGVLFALGGIIGVAGVVQLGRNRTPFPRPRPGSVLVRRGVYRWCRHPLYVSVLLASGGWALLFQSAASLGLAAVLIPFFIAKARREEVWLRATFPDYADYSRQVGPFFPRLRR
ncbi:MAG: isoprenylcysteine carboxylmethyltransferase family protein [Verrucomicrobiales bacterium]|nr:isoprenylcysteine carboxylmethyltransferase family protein [Verrucomicrobiales bacterium]